MGHGNANSPSPGLWCSTLALRVGVVPIDLILAIQWRNSVELNARRTNNPEAKTPRGCFPLFVFLCFYFDGSWQPNIWEFLAVKGATMTAHSFMYANGFEWVFHVVIGLVSFICLLPHCSWVSWPRQFSVCIDFYLPEGQCGVYLTCNEISPH